MWEAGTYVDTHLDIISKVWQKKRPHDQNTIHTYNKVSESGVMEDLYERYFAKGLVRLTNFIEKVHSFDDASFKYFFRIAERDAYILIDQFAEACPLQLLWHGQEGENCSHECAILLTLWYISNTNNETFRQVADRFNLSKNTAHQLLYDTLDFLVSMAHKNSPARFFNESRDNKQQNLDTWDMIIVSIDEIDSNKEEFIWVTEYGLIKTSKYFNINKVTPDDCEILEYYKGIGFMAGLRFINSMVYCQGFALDNNLKDIRRAKIERGISALFCSRIKL